MEARFWMTEADDPWRGRQPRYENIVRIAPMRFGLTTKLPNGDQVVCELAGLPPDPPFYDERRRPLGG